jgi:hypothetical protein
MTHVSMDIGLGMEGKWRVATVGRGIVFELEYYDVEWPALFICVLEGLGLYLLWKPCVVEDAGVVSEKRPDPFPSTPFSIYY